MFLNVVESLLPEEIDSGLIVGIGVDDDHADSLVDHPILYFVE